MVFRSQHGHSEHSAAMQLQTQQAVCSDSFLSKLEYSFLAIENAIVAFLFDQTPLPFILALSADKNEHKMVTEDTMTQSSSQHSLTHIRVAQILTLVLLPAHQH